MNYDEGFESRDPWYAPVLIILAVVAAFIALVFVFNYVAKAADDPYIIRLTANKENKLAVVFIYRPAEKPNEWATKKECEEVLFTKDFFNDVVAPGMYAMTAQYGAEVDIQPPECILASENAKQIEDMKTRYRQQKGEEL
jgi:hypothetical protein